MEVIVDLKMLSHSYIPSEMEETVCRYICQQMYTAKITV